MSIVLNNIHGMFPGDLIMKSLIDRGLEDMRKNPYLIRDCFLSLTDSVILTKEYGEKEVNRAIEFISNNKINIAMSKRLDKIHYPCVIIEVGSSSEDDSLSTLGNSSVMFEEYAPKDVGKSISYIIPPFHVVSYNKEQGIIEIPTDIDSYTYIQPGMVIIDPKTGKGFIIIDKGGDHGVKITPNSTLPNNLLAIIPQYQIFTARREKIISRENYKFSCYVKGDPSTLLFLHGVIKYILLRYREALLEYENFQLSKISSSAIGAENIGANEYIYSRTISLSGQVEESWIKGLNTTVEAIGLEDVDGDNRFLQTGIQILSQDAPEAIVNSELDEYKDPLWITVDDD